MFDKEKTQGFSIRGNSACIVGCGGLGCNVAVHLAGAGIGTLYICDFDTVSLTNLNRQFLFTAKGAGQPKCEAMINRLLEFAPDVEYVAINKKLSTADDLDFAKECDVIICTADNVRCREVVEDFCEAHNIPLVCGGIDGFYGMAYLHIPNISEKASQVGFTQSDGVNSNISATAGIIGSAQAALAIQYLITKDTALSGKLLVYDENRFDTLNIKKQKQRGEQHG